MRNTTTGFRSAFARPKAVDDKPKVFSGVERRAIVDMRRLMTAVGDIERVERLVKAHASLRVAVAMHGDDEVPGLRQMLDDFALMLAAFAGDAASDESEGDPPRDESGRFVSSNTDDE